MIEKPSRPEGRLFLCIESNKSNWRNYISIKRYIRLVYSAMRIADVICGKEAWKTQNVEKEQGEKDKLLQKEQKRINQKELKTETKY